MGVADQAEIVTKVFGWASQAHDLALEWVTSPAAWSKFAILVGAFLLAVLITRKAKPILSAILTVQPKQNRIVGLVKRAGMLALALMLPL
ncbi:MAG TPA: mechanosensitive ion channel protein MscS, partial [Rhodobacteraceae bacterium]|nr:mechanosensitive ion channel protein MscS [Paracoccaceae bacterium]